MKKYFFLFVIMMGVHASWTMDAALVVTTDSDDDDFGFLKIDERDLLDDEQVKSPQRARVESNDLALIARVRAASSHNDTSSDDEGLRADQPASPVTADLLRLMQKERDEMGAVDDDASSDNEVKFDPTKKKRTRKNKKKKKSNAAKVDTFTGNESEPQRQDGVRQDVKELWDTAVLLGGMVLTGWSSTKDAATQAIMRSNVVQSALSGLNNNGGS